MAESSKRLILGTIGTRLVTYPITIGLSLVTASLLIQQGDVESYAAYTLVASLLPFMAFLDLGYGGAITKWTADFTARAADDRQTRREYLSRVRTALHVVSIMAASAAAAGLAVVIFGAAKGGDVANVPILLFGASLAIVGLNQPFAALAKILLGAGQNATWTVIQVVQPLIALGLVAAALYSGDGYWVPLVPAVALLGMCATGAVFGLRSIRTRPSELLAPKVAKMRGSTSRGLVHDAWPMMIILFASPVVLSSDRLIIAATASLSDVATYSLGAQLYAPALSLLSTAGLTLWPYFARLRHQEAASRPWRMMAYFGVAAIIGSVILGLLSPLAAEVISNGKIDIPTGLILVFSLSFTVQAVQFPLSMYMMHGQGPKLQALFVSLMALVKIALSFAFVPWIGLGGPLLATAISIVLLQILPSIFAVRRGLE